MKRPETVLFAPSKSVLSKMDKSTLISLFEPCHEKKKDFCLCQNKGADQLCSNCTADQRLCFHYADSTIPPLLVAKILAFFCDYTGQFVSDLVGNPEACFLTSRLIYEFHF